MGRSKFPGKPSKSINRKRISVLQIDHEGTSTSTRKDQEEENLTAPTTAAAAAKNNNKHSRDDDEDEHGGGDGQAKRSGGNNSNNTAEGGGGGSGGGSNSTNSKNVNGSNNGGSGSGSGGGGGGGSYGQKNGNSANDNNGHTSNHNAEHSNDDDGDVSNTGDNSKARAANSSEDEDDAEESDEDDEDDDDDDDEDEEDDDDDEDEDEENDNEEDDDDTDNGITENSIEKSSVSNKSESAKRDKRGKKFKNLNLLKPEVMLPSSSKQKQQAHNITDLNRLSPTISLNNPFALSPATELKVGNDKPYKKFELQSAANDATVQSNNNGKTATLSTMAITTTTSPPTTTATSTSTNTTHVNSIASSSESIPITNAAASSTTTSKPKKSVTFKNILETSDDKSAVKRFYNPNNRYPLVSIMKKECMNRFLTYSRSNECIVRPSRLTEILKNKNNIDKLNALKFRSSILPSISTSNSASTSSSVSSIAKGPFGIGGLSHHAFGVSVNDDAEKQENRVKFSVDIQKDKNDVGKGDDDSASSCSEHEEDIQRTKDGVTDTAIGKVTHDDDCDDDQQMIVDKHFVLPKRSTRSSRVIKPNKRLVEDGIICRKSILPNKLKTGINATTTTLLAPKKEINAITTATATTQLTAASATTTTTMKTTLKNNYFGMGDYNDNKEGTDDLKLLTSLKESNSDTKPNLSVLSTALGKPTTTAITPQTTSLGSTFGSFGSLKANSNFILRQPRLQFDSLTERSATSTLLRPSLVTANTLLSSTKASIIPKSTFPLTVTNNASNTQASTNCGVCDSNIHSKNMQQARKYETLACAICRKFISKITKKSTATTASPTLKVLQLQCKADGNCCIQPSVKGQSKNFKKVYKERCSACWLKKCIQNLQFSSSHKLRLNAVLASSVIKQSDSKRLVIATPIIESNTLVAKDNEPLSLSCLKREPGLSPTGTPLSSPRLPTTSNAIQQQLKWKSTLDKATEGLRINLKSNPLAENNVTFGSTPLLRPAILEKPLFLKTSINLSSNINVTDKQSINDKEKLTAAPNSDNAVQQDIDKSTSKTKRKHKDKERTKDRERDDTQKPIATAGGKHNENSAEKSAAATELSTEISNVCGAIGAEKEATSTVLNSDTTSASTATSMLTETATTVSATATSNSTNVVGEGITAATIPTSAADNTKRQRIDLKGPRVKHVCRSASIVLGQPLAMFGEEEGEGEPEAAAEEEVEKHATEDETSTSDLKVTTLQANNETIKATATEKSSTVAESLTTKTIKTPNRTANAVIDENENCASCNQQEVPNTQSKKQRETAPPAVIKNAPATKPTSDGKSDISEPVTRSTRIVPTNAKTAKASVQMVHVKNSKGYNLNTTTTSHITKKYMRHFNYSNNIENPQQESRRKDAAAATGGVVSTTLHGNKSKSLISIDFWENYDPAEVCQNGFGLIVTEAVAQRALCFLCGSTGCDAMLFCACCCEPYHQYCVLDEYNLKHSSLDDTMASFLLDTSMVDNAGNGAMTQRLNWLCPRCTVCYTCNMSSGSKVKCQKCQKNYHTTCLGTSKRLLGADRPLICVNCLKCKSCATTKVSKFVGNLPLCTSCFKLRKRGNFCPICQKCYDDNDFDLKMMECGDCKQWVHSKCEGLSDEQYNLLSTLPETIEFICKKCARRNENSKQRAEEWRQTVMEEFKTSLLSVLKQLSKSRQACALLKLSPRKKVTCNCGAQNATGSGRMQPKALLFSSNDREQLGSDGESQCSEDIYEFNECQPGSQLPAASDKLKGSTNAKCTCNQNATTSATNSERNSNSTISHYYNTTSQQTQHLSLVDIKKKIANNAYTSLAEFNYDMNTVIQLANCDELVISYKEILSEQFPWFQNETKACTDALEEDMFESCISYGMNGGSGASLDGIPPGSSGYSGANGDMENNNQLVDLPPELEDVVFTYKSRQDARLCLFCRKTGEGLSNEESRLLYCGHDCWVHTNCAMWSAEVFEEIDGSLQNVHSAVSRGRMIKCTVCGNRGASVGCNVKSCGEHYHYPCARSINCAFLTDKSIYCPTHAHDALERVSSPNVTIETNFEVSRPVYVELDRKRKKLIDPTRVQFHIGSLEVKQLGTVFPRFSDSFEAIVPINFLCSRLYWSCKEPWKIVEYTVRTTIQNSYSTLTALDMGRNFTVDHSNPNSSLVQLGLAQIARWHGSLVRGEFIEMECGGGVEYPSVRSASTLSKLLPEFLTQNQNSILISNADENTEEEPQTNADLLPPDLKDAIFEDLPHELLDGISMLDIFPKFMNYEDMGNASDCRTEAFLSEQSKDGVSVATTTATTATAGSNHISDNDDTMNSSFSKQIELSNSWSSSSTTNSTPVNHVEDAMLGAARNQFKRSLSTDCKKAESLFRKVAGGGGGAVSATAAAIKRRKISKTKTEEILLTLSQQQRVTKETLAVAALARRQSQYSDTDLLGGQRAKTFTWSAAKRYMDSPSDLEATKEDVNNIRLMQVDGVDDSITEYRFITAEAQHNRTVKCDRCHCTYRTYDSFQRHLATCESLSTSESDSDRAPSRSPPDGANTITASHLITAENINELNKFARNAALASAVNTSTANTVSGLPFIQAFQQASTAGIPLGGIQNTASINGIPIGTISGLQNAAGVQTLQNLQGLQNFQSLQNLQFQNIQPQTINGGNFFISPAPTTANTANATGTDELQFFSNALQSLTANLNGTYTLAPTTAGNTGFTVQQQAQAAQPQLIAVSTNPDGTHQIIQLPTTATAAVNPQILQATPNGYQTIQTTNGEKKIVLPMANKPMGNKSNSKAAMQSASFGGKQKVKAGNNVKPIQSKIAPTSVTQANSAMQAPQITVLNTGGGNGTTAAQLLNQNLIQQLQAAANSQQQPLLFQTATGAGTAAQQQPIIMQSPAQNIISFVTTDGAQNAQVQYLSIPSNDYKPQPTAPTSYITAAPSAGGGATNSLLPGTAYLQTDASGNLMLTTAPPATTNGHLQMLSASPLNQSAQVIGTLIQPQTLQLNGNVLTAAPTNDNQQPVIIGGTSSGGGSNGLEMIAAANAAAAAAAPQVILATQPMYYGLETIVQNTVMSSQQFVSTAMPGVLSQNASFSATTTQVFQASKIEPLVDIPAGYVVLNNVDGSSIVQPQVSTAQTQQPTHTFLNTTNLLQQTSTATTPDQQSTNLETIYRLQQQSQSVNDNTTYQFSNAQQQQQSQPQIVTAKIPPVVTQIKHRGATSKTSNSINATKVLPQVVNKVLPTNIVQQQSTTTTATQKINQKQQQQQQQKVTIQQQAPSNIFIRPTNVGTLPVTVATGIDTIPAQHIIVTQAKQPSTSISTTPVYETNIVHQHQQQQQQPQQVYTTMPQMAATITLATASQQSNNAVITAKQLTPQTTNVRKTNLIRPIHKVEVRPKVVKTVQNTSNTVTFSASSTVKQQNPSMTNVISTLNLKPHETVTAALPQQITTATLQPSQQYNLITITQPKQLQEHQQPQNISLQPQQHTTFVYDQQQQKIIEYQPNEQLQQNNATESYQQSQHQQQQQQQTPTDSHSNSNNNTNINRHQLSTANNSYSASVPTNIVNPIQFTTATSSSNNLHFTTTLNSRPTNRVLPMQQKQQQDHSNRTLNSHNSSTNQTCKQQQQYQATKCYESPNNSLKVCYEAEVVKKDHQPLIDEFLQQQQQQSQQQQQQQQHVEQLQQHDTFQVLHDHNTGEIAAAIEFSVSELKNGDLELLENTQQSTGSNHLEVISNNMLNYQNTLDPIVNDGLLCEKQQQNQKLITAYTMDATPTPDTNNTENDVNDECEEGEDQCDGGGGISGEVDNDCNGDDDEDDDGFSLKMPCDDDGMDLDQEISDSDEPAVKEKISKILDNLTNDDCADSIATATTIEAGAMQGVQFMETELCDNVAASNNNENHEKALLSSPSSEVNSVITSFEANVEENMSSAFIGQIDPKVDETKTSAEPLLETLKKFETRLPAHLQAEVDAGMKMDARKCEILSTVERIQKQVMNNQITNAHPPHHPPRDPKKVTGPHLLYEIQSEDGFTYKSTSITEVWEKVFEAVQVARRAHGLAPLPEGPLADMSGVQMIGLKTNALKYLIEQLPGVEKCTKYTPKYHNRSDTAANIANTLLSQGISAAVAATSSCDGSLHSNVLEYGSDQEELQESLYECGRCEPYEGRSEYDMFSWLASRHRKQPIQVFVQPSDTEIIARRGTGSNLPMAMKYRTLKETYKDYVGVFRSHIHGRGLYCTKDIEAGEMVIEYAGELIRSTLTDKRERNYNSRGIGCYMFKIDDNLVVDATMRGNAARFINHSCEPNCYSKVVDILGHKHIIIFALRRIVQGEELTYDYKFPFEDEKIPCSCGSKKCRKYLN